MLRSVGGFVSFLLGVIKEVVQSDKDELKEEVEAKLQETNEIQKQKIDNLIIEISTLQTEINDKVSINQSLQEEVLEQTNKIEREAKARKITFSKSLSDKEFTLFSGKKTLKNFSSEEFSFYTVQFEHPTDEDYLLSHNFTISTVTSGVFFHKNLEYWPLRIHIGGIRDILDVTFEKVSEHYPLASELDIIHISCIKLSYSDDYGGNYNRHYRFALQSNRKPYSDNFVESKYLYDECEETFKKVKQSAPYYGYLDRWNEGNGPRKGYLYEKIVEYFEYLKSP